MDATLQAFADACNYVNDNTNPKLTNKIALQALSYQTIKEQFSLVANMAVLSQNREVERILMKTGNYSIDTAMMKNPDQIFW